MAALLVFAFVITPALRGQVRVAEFLPDDTGVLADEDGEYSGWVEFENTGVTPVPLTGYGFSDDTSRPFKWRFPELTLEGGQRLVVFTSGKDRSELPVSDRPPAGPAPEWDPRSLPGLSLWLDASAADLVSTPEGGVAQWPDGTLRPYQPPAEAPAVTPNTVPGLALWLDAADAQTRGESDGYLATWRDKSGRERHATQTLPTARPAWVAGPLGTLIAMRFDGESDFLDLPEATDIKTAIWVAREDPRTPEFAVLLGGHETYDFHAGEHRILLNSTLVPGRRAWLNGTEVPPYQTRTPPEWVVTSVVSETPGAVSLLGSDRHLPGRFWAGDVGEVLLFDRVLDDAERQGLESYLEQKWRPPESEVPARYDAVQASPARQPRRVVDPLTGLPGVRFDGIDDGLRFPRLDDVVSVVWVAREAPEVSQGLAPLLGDTIQYDLHRGDGGKLYNYLWTSAEVRNGSTWLDGDVVDPTITQVPRRRVMVETVATGPITLSTLGSGRLLDGYYWHGEIHEVLLFNRALEPDERSRLEQYLRHKWRLPDRHLHANFEIAPAGEWLVLTDPAGRPVDTLAPVAVPPGVSFVRAENLASGSLPAGLCAEPSPGATNGSVRFAGITPAPAIDPPSGFFGARTSVRLTVPPEATVNFTLDGSIPQWPLATRRDVVWFDEALPPGAVPGTGSLPWDWTVTTPEPYSGELALELPPGPGARQQHFKQAVGGPAVMAGDRLFAHVWLDPDSPPRSLLLQWRSGDWNHRAFWGERGTWPGTAGTASLLLRGPLPEAGGWVRLEVPAADLELEGKVLDGFAFAILDGGALWDCPGLATLTASGAFPQSMQLVVTNDLVVRARAFREGYLPSPVVTTTYLAGAPPELPVVSLALPPDDFEGPTNGLYAAGPGASPYPPYLGANFWKPWERAAEFTFFETNGTPVLAAGAGLRIHGGYSRSAPQKSFRLYARHKYGTGSFQHPLFPGLSVDRFETLLLRNAGNDWSFSGLRDAAGQALGGELGADFSRTRPVRLYVNGRYWGLYTLMERPDEHFVASHHDVDAEALDTMENGAESSTGDANAYLELLNDCQALDLTQPEAFDRVASRIDLRNFLACHIAQIHLDNSDWPTHNTLLWRPRRPDGQWHWILKDLDGTFDINKLGASRPTLRIALGLEPEIADTYAPTVFLPQMLANPRFRQDFINTFADALNSTLRPEAVEARLRSMEAGVAAEIPRHLARWHAETNFLWPLPATSADWAGEVEYLRQFARERPASMRQQLRDQFALGPDVRIRLHVDDPGLGRIRINTLRLPASELPWEGVYFQGVPLEVEAVPAPGCEFVGWEGAPNAPALARLTPAADLDLQAWFRRVPGEPGPWPRPFDLWQGEYRFESFPADTPPGESPSSTVFLQTPTRDPGLDATFELPWTLPYNLGSRSRVRGLGGRGCSFLNTGNPQEAAGAGYAGAALLALRTEGVRDVYVSWVGGTVTPNERPYALRLQYRVGTRGEFLDVADADGHPVEYARSEIPGDFRKLGPVRLPSTTDDQPVVHLRWVYYRVAGGPDSGARDELRLDEIRVWGQPAAPTLRLEVEPGTGRGWFTITGLFVREARLESSTNLIDWTAEAMVPASREGRVTVPVTLDGRNPGRFYRLWFP